MNWVNKNAYFGNQTTLKEIKSHETVFIYKLNVREQNIDRRI